MAMKWAEKFPATRSLLIFLAMLGAWLGLGSLLFPVLEKHHLVGGFRGFILAALFQAPFVFALRLVDKRLRHSTQLNEGRMIKATPVWFLITILGGAIWVASLAATLNYLPNSPSYSGAAWTVWIGVIIAVVSFAEWRARH